MKYFSQTPVNNQICSDCIQNSGSNQTKISQNEPKKKIENDVDEKTNSKKKYIKDPSIESLTSESNDEGTHKSTIASNKNKEMMKHEEENSQQNSTNEQIQEKVKLLPSENLFVKKCTIKKDDPTIIESKEIPKDSSLKNIEEIKNAEKVEKNSSKDYYQDNQSNAVNQEEQCDIPETFENPFCFKNCYLCKKLTSNFVVYECNHHFCEKCFIKDLSQVPEIFKDLAICICKSPGKIESNSLINFKITDNDLNQFNKFLMTLVQLYGNSQSGFEILKLAASHGKSEGKIYNYINKIIYIFSYYVYSEYASTLSASCSAR